jgi:hypothetical protein
MKVCNHCHVNKEDNQYIKPLTNCIVNQCKKCRIYTNQYRESHRQFLRDEAKKYYREKLIKNGKNYRDYKTNNNLVIIRCACGGKYRVDRMKKHKKTEKHQKFVLKVDDNNISYKFQLME